MNTRAYLAELLGTFLFMMIGYASVAAFRAAGEPPVPRCSSSRSRSASVCWQPSTPSGMHRAGTSTRP